MTFEECLCCGDRFCRPQEEAPGTVLALVCLECLAAGETGGEDALNARHAKVLAECQRLGDALVEAFHAAGKPR